MEKDIIYRINFEGAEAELTKLTQIRERLEQLQDEKTKLNATDKNALERNKLEQQELSKLYKQQQGYIKDQNNAIKMTADTLEQMRAQSRQLGKELEKIPVGTKAFLDMQSKVNVLNTKIRNLDKSAGNFRTNIGNYAQSFGETFSSLGGGISKATAGLGAMATATNPLGLAIVGLGAGVNVFNGALKATDELADRYDVFMSQASEVTTAFFKSIATGDWGNLLGNMRDAIRIGREYAETMDVIKDRSNAVKIAEARANIDIQKQQKILKDATKTPAEQKAAGYEILRIENELALRRKKIAQDELNAEVKRVAARNKMSQKEVLQFVEYYDKYAAQIDKLTKLDEKRAELASLRTSQQSWASGGSARSGVSNANTSAVSALENEIAELEKQTGNYSQAIRNFANVNEEEREILTESLVRYYTEWSSFDEKTQRSATRLSAILAKEMKDNAKNIKASAQEIQSAIIDYPQAWEYTQDLQPLQRKYTDTSATIKPTLTAKNTEIATGDPAKLEGKVDVDAAVSNAGQIVGIWADAYSAREQALKDSLEKGLISEKQYQAESEKIAKRQNNMQRAMAIAQLTTDMARTLSALGVGAAQTAKVGFPLNLPLLIAFAAQAAGIIQNLRSIKLAKGGVIGGNLHSQGGTTFIGSDGSSFEAERGELLTVVNRHDTARIQALSDINSVHGKPFYATPNISHFAQGGIYTPSAMSSNTDSMVRSLVKQIGSIPVVLNTRRLEASQNESRKVELIGNI